MRKKILIKSLYSAFLAVLFHCSSMYGVVAWTNNNTPNVVDDDLILADAAITLETGVGTEDSHIIANTADVLVTMTSQDTVIQGNAGANPTLHMFAATGRTITVDITNDLTFQGGTAQDLLITFSGQGDLIFEISGNRILTFQDRTGTTNGVQFYLVMDGTTPPEVIFRRNTGLDDPDAPVVIFFNDSVMSYLAQNVVGSSTEQGIIDFRGTTTGTGQFIVDLDNGASIAVRAGQVTDLDDTVLGDIQEENPSGQLAIFRVSNSGAATDFSALRIDNKITTTQQFLYDPWCDLGARDDTVDYNGSFTGIQPGFILGANGQVDISNNAYLNYIGIANNFCPRPNIAGVDDSSTVTKLRNASAFIVDGNNNPAAANAQINLGTESAIYFRSGINANGVIENGGLSMFEWTVSATTETAGAGEVILQVEGPLDVFGSNATNETGEYVPGSLRSGLEILSYHVNTTGGPIFVGRAEDTFPKRSFATETINGTTVFRQYNKAHAMLNNNVRLFDTGLNHTDAIHDVFEKNDVTSEPTYVGGDTWNLKASVNKPCLQFYDSQFLVNDDVAITGVDVCVPNRFSLDANEFCEDNFSQFVFFQNGKRVDNGTGRHMILGTQVGSTACDGCTIINRDAHLDVIETNSCVMGGAQDGDLQLALTTTGNNECINNSISTDPANEPSVHTIYIGHSSNISIGSNGDLGTDMDGNSITLMTSPTLLINRNYFAFETRGGENGLPETSHITGQGGIFVDNNGTIRINPMRRASMAVMVTKSRDGVVDLPKSRVFFDSRVGIADWNIDLTDATQRNIISLGSCISDYSFNWQAITKDYANFCPYDVGDYDPCTCPPVTAQHVASLPTVRGEVGQLQIQGSRLGDAAHVAIDCGHVKELIHLSGNNSAETPTSVVVLTNQGRVGLGSAHKSVDSLEGSVTMGVNGVQIIADGDGRVDLNEDIIINNICALLKGPNFGASDVLTIHSDCCRTLRVTSDGILDLTSFDGAAHEVRLSGNVQLILEPGARVVMGGGILHAVDDACILAEPVQKTDTLFTDTTSLTDTDAVRVKFHGNGTVLLDGCSKFIVDRDAYVGVETWSACMVNTTSMRFELRDSAQMLIGDDCFPEGGVFQVGNTADHAGGFVNFDLVLNGPDTEFGMSNQSFFGTSVGIVDKSSNTPNNWLVDQLYNVDEILLEVSSGTFRHNQIFTGSSDYASLFAIGAGQTNDVNYTFSCLAASDALCPAFAGVNSVLTSQSVILGGGNLALTFTADQPINPTVLTTDGVISDELQASILASKLLLPNMFINNGTGQDLFNFLKTRDLDDVGQRSNVGPSKLKNKVRLGYVDRDAIGRQEIARIIGAGGIGTIQEHALEVGAVIVQLSAGAAPATVVGALALE